MEYTERVEYLNHLLNLEFQLNSQLIQVAMTINKDNRLVMNHAFDAVYDSLVQECVALLAQYGSFVGVQEYMNQNEINLIWERVSALENLVKSVCGSRPQLKAAFDSFKRLFGNNFKEKQ